MNGAIPKEIKEVVDQYFETYQNFLAARVLQTDTFIREVFYATKQDPDDQSSLEEMEAYIHQKNMVRLRLHKYEIDEFLMIDSHVCMVGVTREFSNKQRNRVLYFLRNEEGKWRFHHIARSVQGIILDKFHVNEQTGFVIGNEKAALLFLIHRDSPDAAAFMPGNHVHVEGYLEVEYPMSGELFYRIVRINRIH